MNNQVYEDNYTKIVEPKYGLKRNIMQDEMLTKDILKSHSYSISKNQRVDMTKYETYSIDPPGCKDADDAFSIYEQNDSLYLAIHIADPTEYIDLHSDLWKDILMRATTKYPSNRPPIHMMPNKVLELANLQDKQEGEIKNAITVLTEINSETFEPMKEIKLLFSNIRVKKKNAFSYKQASLVSKEMNEFIIGLKIGETLKKKRSFKTKGIKLNELTIAYPIYEEGEVYLYEDTSEEKLMKQMIAEFAIFANSFVGEYLKINLNTGIFRTCNASEWLQTVYNNISGEELLKEIITNGIRADYMSNIESHDLVGMPEYCHFTSPIRRLSDCVCHYLLKFIYFNTNNYKIPFTEIELEKIANKCLNITKYEKKNQYLDIKFRLLQVMDNMIYKNKKVEIEYYITSYSGLFLNLIINKIDNFNVHMSYTLRTRDYTNQINSKDKYKLTIKKVNCFVNYDENTIPELDNTVLSKN